MAADPQHPPAPPTAVLHRLVEQIRHLCELAESLTCRVVELEENLARQEARLAGLREGDDPAAEAELQERLLASERRLAGIEELLRRAERVVPASAVAAPAPPPALQQDPLLRPLATVAPSPSPPPPGAWQEGEEDRDPGIGDGQDRFPEQRAA
jgi:hypothetical protein